MTLLKSLLTQTSPAFMGIVNVTPDSFYDGGLHNTKETSLSHIKTLLSDGADIIDLGAESTRPGSNPISVDEEISRLDPIISNYNYNTPLSIDTQKSEVAKWALLKGASIINDVSGLRDPDMAPIVGEHDAGLVIMHMKGTPMTMQNNPRYSNIMDDLLFFFESKIKEAQKHKVSSIILDPGIGFGKTVDHNLEILANCSNKTTYSGKILTQEDLKNINFVNKEKLLSRLGNPSYVDPIENKLFYFSERSEKKSIFNKEIEYSYVFVFKLDKNDQIIDTKVFNTKEIKNIKLSEDETSNQIVKRGLLEKIFGGVGTQQELPTTP